MHQTTDCSDGISWNWHVVCDTWHAINHVTRNRLDYFPVPFQSNGFAFFLPSDQTMAGPTHQHQDHHRWHHFKRSLRGSLIWFSKWRSFTMGLDHGSVHRTAEHRSQYANEGHPKKEQGGTPRVGCSAPVNQLGSHLTVSTGSFMYSTAPFRLKCLQNNPIVKKNAPKSLKESLSQWYQSTSLALINQF